MKIRVISNIGLREVTTTTLREGDDSIITVEDVMASEELSDFQVILPVCKDRQLTEPLSEKLSLQKQGLLLKDNNTFTIYCKFKLKEETNSQTTAEPSADISASIQPTSSGSSSGTSTIKNKGFSKIGNRKPKHNKVSNNMEALSPMHIKPKVVTRKRSKVSSVDKLLFSPPPPNKKSEVVVAASLSSSVSSMIPKLSMRKCNNNIIGGFDDFMEDNEQKEALMSPLRIKPTTSSILRKRSNSHNNDPSTDLFSPDAKSNNKDDGHHNKKTRLDFHPTPPSVLQLQEVLDAEGN